MVGAVEGAGHPQVFVVAEALGQVLEQRAAVGDVDELHPAADPEHRQVALDRGAHERDLEAVALGHRVERLGMGLLAIARRVDVGAAGQHQPVEQVERFVGLLEQQLVGRQHHDQRPSVLHRLM